MPQPTPYAVTKDFSQDEANSVAGRSTVLTAGLDTELANIQTTISEILTNLALIQRDDGVIANASIGIDQLKTEVSIGINAVSDWTTATDYALRSAVWKDSGLYYCLTEHTSGVFADDLTAAKWLLLVDFTAYDAAASASADAAEVSKLAAAVSAAASEVSRLAADEDAAQTRLDVIQTGLDVIQTGLDVATTTALAASQGVYKHSLVKLFHPDQAKGLQELQKAGAYPVSFNQQWGGMGYGGLPDGTLGEIATQNMVGYLTQPIANAVGQTYIAEGFKVGQTTNLQSVWIKLFKVGNPTNNLELYIYSDAGGDPDAIITNGTAIAQSGKIHTDNANGEWVKFTFTVNPNVVAGTQYHIVMKSSGAVDASNYWRCFYNGSTTYPHGSLSSSQTPPTWPNYTSLTIQFLVEAETTILSTGLTNFDGALHCYEGTPLDQSGAYYYSNNELNHKRGLIHYAGTGFTKDKTFHDSGLATDNNRIVIRTNVTTGYAQVDLYEGDGTKHTVTGTTDISTGNHIVSVGYRAEGDGADFLKLYVDGVSEGTPLTAQTITLDRAFEDGHFTIGGGFPLAPTWTDDEDMSVLPSASGWTFTGTATEGDAFSVSGGKLYQQTNYASTLSAHYLKSTTLNNATGWIVEAKLKIKNAGSGISNSGLDIRIRDGAKDLFVFFNGYYIEAYSGASLGFIQVDMSVERNVKILGKGSDFYIYIDNKLVFDGTGLLTSATATNDIRFGDSSTTSGLNTNAEWSYFKYYEGAHLPEYSDVQISEFAHWNDDKSALLSTIYNAGTIQSVKTLAGMNENYVKPVKQVISVKGIIAGPTTASPTPVPLADMNGFCFGSDIAASFSTNHFNSTSISSHKFSYYIDGEALITNLSFRGDAANTTGAAIPTKSKGVSSGLHYCDIKFATDTGTVNASSNERDFRMEAE